MGYVAAAEDDEPETRTLVGPAQEEAKAREARMEKKRAQARIEAGDEAYRTALLLGATAEAAEEEARRFKELVYPPGCVIHEPGDGYDTGLAEERLLASWKPAPPRRRPDGRATCWDWYILPLPSKFPRPHPDEPIPVGEPLDILQARRLWEKRRRAVNEPGHFEQLAIDRELVEDCLRHYNSTHPGDEYVPAAGRVTRSYRFDDGACWTHGNFVARRKRSACCGGFFSFLPLPSPRRTLFFFELVTRGDVSHGVVTCTPLLDEPVTEAYSVLGFRLCWPARRSGSLDCVCKTCRRRLDVTHPDLMRTFACGHREVERVCKMCYLRSPVLHPPPGEFAFGYHDRKRTC